MLSLDNLYHDVCLQGIPVVFAIDRAGISGPDGSTHHGIYDISFLNAMPNMIITQPRNGQVLKELLESGSNAWKNVYFISVYFILLYFISQAEQMHHGATC